MFLARETRQKKREEGHPHWTGGSRTLPLTGSHTEKSKDFKLDKFRNVAANEINIQKPVVFLHSNNKVAGKEIKKAIPGAGEMT